MKPRLRDVLATPGRFGTVVELVPWRGALTDTAGGRTRAFAHELATEARIDAISLTDGAGGHAVLSPEVLAEELIGAGQPAIAHVACRDRNRNELLSLAWRLAGAGIEDVLALSGDYPTDGYLGVARPVFDIDSVALVHLYDRMNQGLAGSVVARPLVRDGAREIEPLVPARGSGAPARTDFNLGVAVSPFKTVERDQVPQYLKLEMKVRAGATYAITQVGWDARKLDELARWVRDRSVPVTLLANVYVLTRGSARVMAAGEIPGVVVPPSLLEAAEREGAAEDKGKAFFLDIAARQTAIARRLGYAAAYIGGVSKTEDVLRILSLADGYADAEMAELVRTASFAAPDTWYAYEPDRATGLNTDRPVRLARTPSPDGSERGLLGGAPLAYRVDRFLHSTVFDPSAPLFPVAGTLYGAAERAGLGRPLHVIEQTVKTPLFDCRDCGDCSLPEIAYLCPESQCVKNQRNGPCGGSTAGDCEIPGRECIWARAYDRLAPYGEAMTMLEKEVTVIDNALKRTSAWGNAFLRRDHVGRTEAFEPTPADGPAGTPAAAPSPSSTAASLEPVDPPLPG